MKLVAILAGLFMIGLSLTACAGGEEGNTETYIYPSESMEPTISYQEEVSANLDAYDRAAPARGDIVAFHPPARAGLGECEVRHPPSQACPEPTPGLSSQTFLKRIVAVPGDELSIHEGLPIVNGKAVLTEVIQRCSGRDPDELCELPKPITIPPGHYFIMGDNSGASDDSRYWGPIPRAAILGEAELG